MIAKRLGTLPTESTTRWLANISDDLHAKVAAVGLCEGRGDTLLGPLLDAYIKQNGGGKEQGTLDRWRDDVNRLLEFFGAERNVKSVREYDCEEYKQHLYNVKEYAHSTIGKALRNANQFFAWFVRRGVISQNPWVWKAKDGGRSRSHFRYSRCKFRCSKGKNGKNGANRRKGDKWKP